MLARHSFSDGWGVVLFMQQNQNSQIILYSNQDGNINLEVKLIDETVWLSQKQMASLFQTDRTSIAKHIKNIFETNELNQTTTCAKFAQHLSDNRTYNILHYNLDMIISVGYRVNSIRGTQFRIWATQKLKEYIIKGFAMDDERLKGAGGGNYWKELLERIRDIRSSEKVLYRQVLDLYATSIDYDPKSQESILFFKTVQNKLHYATNQQTAAELIFTRADAEKQFMGMTNFSGTLPTKSDSIIAKNYLTKDELYKLNRLVSAFFDLAEIKAQEKQPMKMKDWLAELDKFSEIYGKGKLINAGKISHKKAMEKVEKEYLRYQVRTLSPVEKDYLDTIKTVQKKITKK